jgi:DNA-binding response OmpR family regulator
MSPESSLVLVVGRLSSLPADAMDRLADRGFEVRCCSTGQEALHELAAAAPTVVVADIELEDMDGFELEASVADLFPGRRIPVVLLVDGPWSDTLGDRLTEGAHDYLLGPVGSEELVASIERVLSKAGAADDPPARHPSEPAPGSRGPRLAARVTGVAVGDHLVNVETEYDSTEGGQIATLVTVDGTPRRRTTSAPPPRMDRHEIEQYMAAQHEAVAGGVRVRLEALLVQKHHRPVPTDDELDRCLWLVRHACAKHQYAAAREIVSGALAMFPASPALHGYRQWLESKPD